MAALTNESEVSWNRLAARMPEETIERRIVVGNSLGSDRLEKGNENGGKYQLLHNTDDFIIRVILITCNSKQVY
jgi:hypothetical protein